MTVTRGQYRFEMPGGSCPEEHTATTEALLAAMREGLEANGFDVEIEAIYETRLAL